MSGGTEESVAKLSTRLLEGWTMLSETCPRKGCTVPLMRSRDNTEISCVNCGTRYTDDYKPVGGLDLGGSGPTGQGEAGRYEPPPCSRPVGGVARDTEVVAPPKPEPPRLSTSPAKPRKRRDDSCKGLAEKLLQGWTLTDQYCPVEQCLTPLVRSRDKKLLCVDCDKWVVTENEAYANASPMKQEPAPTPPAKEASAPAAPQGVVGSGAQAVRDHAGVCTRAIDVLFNKMNLCVNRMERLNQVPGSEASELLEFLSNTSKTILTMSDLRDCMEATR